MPENAKPNHPQPRWFRAIAITYITFGILFFITLLVIVITKDDRPIQLSTITYELMSWGAMLLIGFTFAGVPALAFLSWGLRSQNKILKYLLYSLAGAWLILYAAIFISLLIR